MSSPAAEANLQHPDISTPSSDGPVSSTEVPKKPVQSASAWTDDNQSRPTEIDRLREQLTKWLSIPPEDAEVIDFYLAVYKSHELPGDPLWAISIDASGAGKTELLRSFRGRKDAYPLSSLTEKTLISGYRDPKNPKKDPSLLPHLHEKVLIIKDLSPLLQMRRESRNIIIGQLRDIYDGFTDEGRGNLGKVSYESRFSFLSASTLSVDRFDSIDQELGERFIKFRARGDGSRDKVRRALQNVGCDTIMRTEISKAMNDFLDSLPRLQNHRIPDCLMDRLINIADFAAKARSAIARDRNGEMQYLPKPEVGTRLGKELAKLLIALAGIRGKSQPDEADFATVARVADDCLPPNRLAVIQALRKNREPLTACKIAEDTGLPRTTAVRALDDLKVLGLVTSSGANEFEQTRWKLVSR